MSTTLSAAGFLCIFTTILSAQAVPPSPSLSTFANFETGATNPVRITPDQTKLLALNVDAGRLSVFSLTNPSAPALLQEIPVGIEPVCIAPRNSNEIWVANQVSDSISIISLSAGIVTNTIQTGDEPMDIVFTGNGSKAYVSIHGKNRLEVYDTATKTKIKDINLALESPRALAVSNDGLSLFVLSYMSNNRTTVVTQSNINPGDEQTLIDSTAPQTTLIVSADDPNYSAKVTWNVRDNDIAQIDLATDTVTNFITGVGTINFQMARKPGGDELFVVNTDATNTIRFENVLKGKFINNRVTKANAGPPSHFSLDAGIDKNQSQTVQNLTNSLAQPTAAVFDNNGSHLYIVSLGADRVAEVDPANGNITNRWNVGTGNPQDVDGREKRGPMGAALLQSGTLKRLYIWNRISASISILNLTAGGVTHEFPVGGYDPIPAEYREGRGFLYDAKLGNGDAACASCHMFADRDALAWDLGLPGGQLFNVNLDPQLGGGTFNLHPMKGPMATQSLRGMVNTGPLHWRGDKPTFQDFNPAFDGLLGGQQISQADMDLYTSFIMQTRYPANPNRNLDNTLPATMNFVGSLVGNAANGEVLFSNGNLDGIQCSSCHALPKGTNTLLQIDTIPPEIQAVKVAHLRNLYQKSSFDLNAQMRSGVGFIHNGSIQTLALFLLIFPPLQQDFQKLADVAAFCLSFDTGTAPSVGATRTIRGAVAPNAPVILEIQTLQKQALLSNCEVVALGKVDSRFHGFWYDPAQDKYISDKAVGYGPFTLDQLRLKASIAGSALSFMGVAPGTGKRISIDRDLDNILNQDEVTQVHYTHIGTASTGCCGTDTIGVNSEPFIGNENMAIIGTGAPAGAICWLIVSPTQSNFTYQGCTIYSDFNDPLAFLIPGNADDTGVIALRAAIANDPNLVGQKFYLQWGFLDAAGPAGVISTSDALELIPFAP